LNLRIFNINLKKRVLQVKFVPLIQSKLNPLMAEMLVNALVKLRTVLAARVENSAHPSSFIVTDFGIKRLSQKLPNSPQSVRAIGFVMEGYEEYFLRVMTRFLSHYGLLRQ